MKKKLIIAATRTEIQPFIDKNPNIDYLITGIGMIATTYQLTKKLQKKKYDHVINAGIAGAFDTTIKIGEVIEIISEEIEDFGIENDTKFQSVFDADLLNKNEFPFTNGKLLQPLKSTTSLPEKRAISVNKVHGNENSITNLMQQYYQKPIPQVESMEGAAFFYVCLSENVNFIQIRAISNYVEKRDKSKWSIPLAIKNLNIELEKIVAQLCKN